MRYLKQFLLGLAVLPVLLSPALANAAASGLSISPLRQDLTLKPGQADKIDITLKNITGGPILAKANVVDFTSDNATGNPKLITDPNAQDPYSIKNFLVGLGDVPLATGEQKTFSIPVQVPATAAPGAYFGLIEYQAVPVGSANQPGNKVALSAAVSQLVFITVPGNIVQRMSLDSINVYHDTAGTSQGLFFTKPPRSAGIKLTNLGNGFGKPFGTVTLQNSSGKTVYTYQVNSSITPGLVLPNSSRIFVNPLKNIKHPGRYTLVASLSYGSGGSAILTGKKTFWYIPVWLIIVVILLILALILAIWLVRRRYKRVTTTRYRP